MKALNDYMEMSFRMEIVKDKDEGGYVVAGNHFLPHVEIVPIFDIPDYEGDCRSMERRRRRLSTR